MFPVQKQRAGGERPRRLIEWRYKMGKRLVLLPRIIGILTIKVKVIVRVTV
jgi:hypothetical protein